MTLPAGFSYSLVSRDGWARLGVISTPHGRIETPAFIPVGTRASVKTLDSADLKQIGVQAVLANTYHLYLRPGAELVRDQGGLHEFMNWDGPIFTDSGGFQVFSLGFGILHGVGKVANIFPDEESLPRPKSSKPGLMKVDGEGVTFRSHIDGSSHRFTAERSIEIQQQLGADIIFAFDECTSPLHDERYTAQALARTHEWAKRSQRAWTNRGRQALYGIVQGGAYKSLREQSAAFISGLDFPGIAIGGSLGRSKRDMHSILEWTMPLLDDSKPRHLLGIGEVADLFECAARGIDSFDCAAPTRMARNGAVYIRPANGGTPQNKFRFNITAAGFRDDGRPIDPGCDCYGCRHHTRAYLRHLFNSGEMLGMRLATAHNLRFVERLMSDIRQAIGSRTLRQLGSAWGLPGSSWPR